MIHAIKKLGIIVIILLFIATSITIVSARNSVIVESKTDGEPITESFNLCYIESSGFGSAMYYRFTLIPWPHIFNDCTIWYLDCNNAITTITTPTKTIIIKGNHTLDIHSHKIILFRIGFFGEYDLPPAFLIRNISLKGIARGGEVTYYK